MGMRPRQRYATLPCAQPSHSTRTGMQHLHFPEPIFIRESPFLLILSQLPVDIRNPKKTGSKAGFFREQRNQTTAPPVSSFSLIGLIRSSRLTPSHMATAAATNTDE